MTVLLKAIHIGGLACWCAALIALPLLIRAYGTTDNPRLYTRFRWVTHMGYIAFATPAAILTITAGTVLIFTEQVFDAWMLAKLAFVAGMVLLHVWFGHIIRLSGEAPSRPPMTLLLLGLIGALVCIMAVLVLVLGKPPLEMLEQFLPAFVLQPRQGPS